MTTLEPTYRQAAQMPAPAIHIDTPRLTRTERRDVLRALLKAIWACLQGRPFVLRVPMAIEGNPWEPPPAKPTPDNPYEQEQPEEPEPMFRGECSRCGGPALYPLSQAPRSSGRKLPHHGCQCGGDVIHFAYNRIKEPA